ncbi:secreted RxLR effector protein 161-like [Humulus lupulus]|uniref:secreted RxLR effector protein 161-like n=1 Tax=Humulus lupulus TaxID=3486 RepID=UPI002B40E85C|nr:secreted RxLR effector protein 161-like [Humulus lupulus]
MEVERSSLGISVTQQKYVIDLLYETRMIGCKLVDTLMDPNTKLGAQTNRIKVDTGRYQHLVGKLIYLAHTRPDISFVVSVVSQFLNNLAEEHMDAVYLILRYIKGTPGKGLMFKKYFHNGLKIYADANWASSLTDQRSTSGYCSYIWGNLVSWRNKKHQVVARSSAEEKFRALVDGICEGMWLKRLLDEL